MLILGVHGGYKSASESDPLGHAMHDGAACLIDHNGSVVAAVEQERLDRIKHSNCFPADAIHRCLAIADRSLHEVDRIAFNISKHALEGMERALLFEDSRMPMLKKGATRLDALFLRNFGADFSHRFRYCHHHLAHGWSAYAPSGFEESLILSIDGDGDNCSGMMLNSEGNTLRVLREYTVRQSLGNLYLALIRFLGYTRFDEYKVMGLAPYGNPNRYSAVFERCYRLLPEGDYTIQEPAAWFREFEAVGLLSSARRRDDSFTQAHKDFAACIQVTLERIAMHMLEHYRKTTQLRKLCLAGGVAHNCTLNGKILRSGLFEDVFVQPAAHDAGGALGAAYAVLYNELPSAPRRRMRHVFLGSPLGNTQSIRNALEKWSEVVRIQPCENVGVAAARELAVGSVIGWVQGRSEFGPRALGGRSILADPRPAMNKLRINEMVKKREAYRPFAPSVLEERVADFFQLPTGNLTFPFMVFSVPVRPEMCDVLGAVTHIDGTARIQTVSREDNPAYWELISEFEKLTGIPVLLNTSFNNHAEPIVDLVDEAVACMLTVGLNLLVVDRFLIRRQSDVSPTFLRRFVPFMLPARKLVIQASGEPASASCLQYKLESTKSGVFQHPEFLLTSNAFQVLSRSSGAITLGEILAQIPLSPEQETALLQELHDLWSERAIAFRPSSSIGRSTNTQCNTQVTACPHRNSLWEFGSTVPGADIVTEQQKTEAI